MIFQHLDPSLKAKEKKKLTDVVCNKKKNLKKVEKKCLH